MLINFSKVEVSTKMSSCKSANRSIDRDPEIVFRSLFESHYHSVYYFFFSHDLSAEDSRDFTQETFLNAYKSFQTFRGESKITTWLFQIATNIWRNSIRRDLASKRNAVTISFDEHMEEAFTCPFVSQAFTNQGSDQLESILKKEGLQLLYEGLVELPPQMRRCVLMRVSQDLKYREIALIMKISINTVKSLLFQARQILKNNLGEYFLDYDPIFNEKEQGEDMQGKMK